MTPGTLDHPHLRDESGSALPVAPSLGDSLDAARMPRRALPVEPKILRICVLAVLLGVCAAFIAQLLVALTALVTNLALQCRWSLAYQAASGDRERDGLVNG